MASSITELIPEQSLRRFLHRRSAGRKLVLVAITGAHAYGFPHEESPLELKGIHVEPTESLVGLSRPHLRENWVDEFEGHPLDYASQELGESLERLLRGDGSVLERIMAPRQLIRNGELKKLRQVARGAVSRRFHRHYRNFCRGVLDNWEEAPPSPQHLLSIYRSALTGAHLLRTAKLELDLPTLAREYKMLEILRLVRTTQRSGKPSATEAAPGSRLEGAEGPWLALQVRLSALLEDSLEQSPLPAEPRHPERAEEYVLDMRRRFFDALTVQD